MTRFHRRTFRTRLHKTKQEIQRELDVEKAAFYASGGKSRSFYERRAAPDAFRREAACHEKWRPKFRNTQTARRNAKAKARKERKTRCRLKKMTAPHTASPTRASQKPRFVTTREVLKRYAEKLNANVPASEKWFLSLYEAHGLLHNADKFNEPFADVCIPDIVNHEFRYIIEVQDPTHRRVERIVRDARKNVLFAKSGYRAFYVWAWDHLSFDAFLPVFKEFLESKRRDPLVALESFD